MCTRVGQNSFFVFRKSQEDWIIMAAQLPPKDIIQISVPQLNYECSFIIHFWKYKFDALSKKLNKKWLTSLIIYKNKRYIFFAFLYVKYFKFLENNIFFFNQKIFEDFDLIFAVIPNNMENLIFFTFLIFFSKLFPLSPLRFSEKKMKNEKKREQRIRHYVEPNFSCFLKTGVIAIVTELLKRT